MVQKEFLPNFYVFQAEKSFNDKILNLFQYNRVKLKKNLVWAQNVINIWQHLSSICFWLTTNFDPKKLPPHYSFCIAISLNLSPTLSKPVLTFF